MIRWMNNGTADVESTPTNSRSEAQREASRRNGARSRGPKTAAGRARSSRNSIKHGLFARKVAPPDGDPAEHDRMYWAAHRQLTEEFNPKTFTERATVAELAHLHVQLGRVTQMIEALQEVPLGPEELEQYEALRERRADLKALETARTCLEEGGAFGCEADEARRLAEMVAAFVEGVFQELAGHEAEMEELREEARQRAAEDPLRSADAEVEAEIEEDEEDQQLRELAELLEPVRQRLTDRSAMQRAFTDEQGLEEDELEALRRVVDDRGDHARVALGLLQDVGPQVDKKVRDTTANLASDPQQLLRLEDYRERLTRSIERQIARLQR